MTTRKRVLVSGRVQGVFFRDTCRQQARSAGVSGWVSNRADGRVEAAFEGEDEAVQRMVEWCHHGSGPADVFEVEVTDEEPTGESGFSVR